MMPLRKNGFSLLELMIVLLIAGLMMALTVPWFSGSVSHMNLKTSARKAAATLRYARSLAASENRIWASVADRHRQTIVIIKDSDISDNYEPGSRNLKTYRLPEGISFGFDDSDVQSLKNDRMTILFYPSGNSSGGELIIRNEKKQSYRIFVDAITGTVKIEG